MRNQRALRNVESRFARARRLLAEYTAQGTLEYALTVFALLSVVTAFGLLWRAGQDGTLAALVERAASHGFDWSGLLDIPLY